MSDMLPSLTSQDSKMIAFSEDSLSMRRVTFTLRRNSRTKSQHYRQSNSRVSKRFMPEPGARRTTRITNTVRDAKIVAVAADSHSEVQIRRITTFTPTFHFRSPIYHEKAPPEEQNTLLATSRGSDRADVKTFPLQESPIFTAVGVKHSVASTRLTDLPAEVLHIIFDQMFDPSEMSTHGRLAAFESASQVSSVWRSIILSKTFKLYYQLQKGRWRFDEFRYSPWEASFVYLPSWKLYHRDDCNCFGRERQKQEQVEGRPPQTPPSLTSQPP